MHCSTQVVTSHPLLPGLRPKDAHGTDKGYVKEQSDAQAHVVAIPSEVSLKKPSNPLSANLFMKVWRPFGVLFQIWMCLENPIADLILYYWFLHLFTQSVELRSFWVNHLSIGSLRIRWLPRSPCNPRHSMCPLFRSFGINWPEPVLCANWLHQRCDIPTWTALVMEFNLLKLGALQPAWHFFLTPMGSVFSGQKNGFHVIFFVDRKVTAKALRAVTWTPKMAVPSACTSKQATLVGGFNKQTHGIIGIPQNGWWK